MPTILFSGLDPVPIRLDLTDDRSPSAIYTAAGIPPSPFIQTVQPYQINQSAADVYELTLGAQGFGAELLDALRWLARVAAAGILNTLPSSDVIAFVKHYLEIEKPEWGYEELTNHATTFITDRYQRATTDSDYQHGLESHRQNPALSSLNTEITQWINTQNTS